MVNFYTRYYNIDYKNNEIRGTYNDITSSGNTLRYVDEVTESEECLYIALNKMKEMDIMCDKKGNLELVFHGDIIKNSIYGGRHSFYINTNLPFCENNLELLIKLPESGRMFLFNLELFKGRTKLKKPCFATFTEITDINHQCKKDGYMKDNRFLSTSECSNKIRKFKTIESGEYKLNIVNDHNLLSDLKNKEIRGIFNFNGMSMIKVDYKDDLTGYNQTVRILTDIEYGNHFILNINGKDINDEYKELNLEYDTYSSNLYIEQNLI